MQHRGLLPVLSVLPLLPESEAFTLAALREAVMSLFKIKTTPQLPSNTDLPLITRSLRRANRNHLTSSFKIQQIPHQGGELVSVWLVSSFLFKDYSSSEQGRIPFPHRSVMPSFSDLQQDLPTFPGSLHPEMLARSLFYTSQQSARSIISLRNNLTMGNKFTFSLKILLWV